MAHAVFKLPVLYLVSADFDTNGNIIKNSLQPIPDTLFVTRRTSAQTNQEETVLWTTNYQGYVNLVKNTFIQGSREGKLFEHNQKIHIFFPNPRVISNIYCEHGEKNFLSEVQNLVTEEKLQQPGSSNQVTILCDLPKKEYMRDPDDVDEDWYTQWYESVGDDYEVKAIVVPKVEVLIISFSDELFKGAEVRLWPHQSEYKNNILAQNGSDNLEKPSSLLINTQRKQKIQEGLYNIRIILSRKSSDRIKSSQKKHAFQVDDKGLFYYELKENITFAYKTPTADFCLVNGDPIHLEEAMLKQFPDILKDVVKATRDLAQGEGGETGLPAGLNAYMHDINLRHDYSKKIAHIATVKPNELIKGFDGQSRIDAAKDILQQFLVDEQYYHASMVTHIALEGHSLLGNYDALKKAYELKKKYDHFTGQMEHFIRLAANTELSAGAQNVMVRLADNLNKERIDLNELRKAFDVKSWFNPRNAQALDAAKEEYAILAKLGIPPRLLYVGMRAMAAWGVFSGLFDVYEEYKLLSKAKKQARKTVEDYQTCVLEYKKAIAEAGDPDVHKAEQQLKLIAAKTKSNLPVKRIFKGGLIELRANIRFGLDQYTTNDIPVADIVELVNNQPKAKLSLHGHACPLGSDHYNMILSKKRVENIKQAFENEGIQLKKVKTDFCGESYPLNNKKGGIDYEESRRVEVCVSLPDAEFIFRPSREAMQVLEKHRFAQVNSAMGLEKQQQKMLMAVFNAGVGMAALIPQYAVVATAILVLPTAAKSVMTLAEYVDRTAFDSILSYWKAHKRLEDQLDKRSKFNQRRIDASPDPSDQKDYIKYLNNQYRIRAEILTALLKLLMRASYRYGKQNGRFDNKNTASEEDQALADKCLNELRIKEFIDFFVLNPEAWHYPHLVNFGYNLDQFWMDCLDMKDVWTAESWQQQSNTYFEKHPLVQRITESIQRVQSGASPYYSVKQMEGGALLTPMQGKPSDVCSKFFIPCTFQQCFPIHAINSENLSVLMHNFDLNYAKLNNDIYKFTAMYVRPYGVLPSDRGADRPWVMMEEYLKTHDGISPLDQVRIIVVLYKDDEYAELSRRTGVRLERPLPITLKPRRIMWGSDCTGPAYTDVCLPLAEDNLLENEKEFEGYYGVVLFPRFQFGAYVFPGTKPMSRDLALKFHDKNQWKQHHRLELSYTYDICVGDNKDSQRQIRIEGNDHENNKPINRLTGSGPYQMSEADKQKYLHKRPIFRTDFTLVLDKERKHQLSHRQASNNKGFFAEKDLFDEELMKSHEKKFEYGKLFDGEVAATTLFKTGENGHFTLSSTYNKKQPFDWRKRCYVGTVVLSSKTHKENYERHNRSWHAIPYSLSQTEKETKTTGAEMQGTLFYAGTLKVKFKHHYRPKDHVYGAAYSEPMTLDNTTWRVENKAAFPEINSRRYLPTLLTLFESQQEKDRKQVFEMIKKSQGKKGAYIYDDDREYDIYLSVIPLKYHAATGKTIEGLRPMGKVDNQYWEKVVKDIPIIGGVLDEVKLIKNGLFDDMCIQFNQFKTISNSGFNGDDSKLVGKGCKIKIDKLPISLNPKQPPWLEDPAPDELASAIELVNTVIKEKQYIEKTGKLPVVKQENVKVNLNWKEMWLLCKRLDHDNKNNNYKLLQLDEWLKSANPSDAQTDGFKIIN